MVLVFNMRFLHIVFQFKINNEGVELTWLFPVVDIVI